MSFDQDRFMDYFRDPHSEDDLPQVRAEDLEDFESNLEEREMHVFRSFKTGAANLTIRGLVRLMDETQPYWPKSGDLAGPFVDSWTYPPVQVPGVRIYRIIKHHPHAESGI